MIRSIPSIFAALLALTFAPGCPADGGDTDTDAATAVTTGATVDATVGTTGGTMATTGTEPTTGEEPAVQTCTDYCTAVTSNCVGATAQYSSMDTCMGSCKAFELGTAADMAGDTLGCRIYHAGAAKADPTTHCTHAGPGGADLCGSNCESFCNIADSACAGTFADNAACMTACAAYDQTEVYDAADAAGDTFACRLYHLTVATTLPADHCAHILPDSAPCAAAP